MFRDTTRRLWHFVSNSEMENYKSWQRNISLYFIRSPTLSPPSPSIKILPFFIRWNRFHDAPCSRDLDISLPNSIPSSRLYALYDRPIDDLNKFSQNTITFKSLSLPIFLSSSSFSLSLSKSPPRKINSTRFIICRSNLTNYNADTDINRIQVIIRSSEIDTGVRSNFFKFRAFDRSSIIEDRVSIQTIIESSHRSWPRSCHFHYILTAKIEREIVNVGKIQQRSSRNISRINFLSTPGV